MSWPSHLATDVRFGYVAAADAAAALRGLADAISDHATVRAQGLARADDFVGGVRDTVDDLTGQLANRAAALVTRLHAEARSIEDDADEARRQARRLEERRASWLAEQRRAAEERRREQQRRIPR